MTDIKQKVLRGGIARIAVLVTNMAIRVVSMVVLARLLDPHDFGLVAMVTATTGIFALFRDFGLSTATIQRESITDEQVSTLFWMNMLIAAVLCVAALATAPLLVEFYHEPRLFWITVAIAMGFLFNGASVQHTALIERHLRFGTLALLDVTNQLVGTAIGIGMAALGFGYWALVGMAIIPLATYMVGVWILAAWVPGRPRRNTGAGAMLKFGWSVTVSQLVMYFGNNSDKFLLGRYWGAQELGTYGRAMQLISLPSESLAQALGGVAFPALSRVQSDPQQFRRFFLKGYALILSTTIPVTIACGIFAADIVLVMLGEKWRDAIAIFQAASPAILIFGITRPFNWMLLAKGETRRNLQVALVQVPLMIAAIVAGLPGGGVGVAEMYSYMMLLWAIPNLLWVIRGTAITAGDLLAVIGKPLLASVLAGAAAHASIDSIDTLLENLMANPFLAEELVALLHGRSPYALARLILECSVHFGLYYLILMYALGEIAFYRDLLRTMFRRSSA